MSAAPTPTSKTPRAPDHHRGRSTPSRRLVQTIREHDVKGERAIAVAQAGIAALMLTLHAVGLPGIPNLQGWGPLALIALIVSSGVRWRLTTDERLPEAWLDALSVLDVAIVISLIWSYQFGFDVPASAVIRPPAFAILLLIVGVRALRFHPRPIVITGLAAMAGWLLMICAAVMTDGFQSFTADYHTYLSSFQILPAAEVVRLIALTGIVVVLASGAFNARRLLGRAAHASDYGEALEAARQHLEHSVQARERAENALASLDARDAELSEQNRLFNAALAKMSRACACSTRTRSCSSATTATLKCTGSPRSSPGRARRSARSSRPHRQGSLRRRQR